MPRIYANNFSTTTAADITNSGTTLVIASATGLPTLTGTQYYYLTLDNLLGTTEIVKVTARTGTSLTIVRGQEGTTGVAWLTGAVIEMRETAASYSPDHIISQQSLTSATVATGDLVLIQDVSDSNNLKTVTTQSIADLAGASVNTFGTIAVSGQSDIVADSSTDTLTIAAGSNITLTTNASTDTLTIAASGGGGRDRDAYTTTVTSAATTTLTVSSNYKQYFTGSTLAQIVKMPVTSTLTVGQDWVIVNNSTVLITVVSSGTNTILELAAGTAAILTCIGTSLTTAADWSYAYAANIGGVFYPFITQTGNLTVTASTKNVIYYGDSGTVNNTMPVVARCTNGQTWTWINNKSSGDINVYASDTTTLMLTIPIGYAATFICKDNTGGTGASPWIWDLWSFNNKGDKPIIQTVYTSTGTVATGSTQIPRDNTIPQNTEGDEYMTLAITPTNSNNILEIEVLGYFSNGNNGALIGALFQDSTANALKAGAFFAGATGCVVSISLKHRMTAGTTSSTTFKFRCGMNTTGTTTFNGLGGSQDFGGVYSSYIKITEYKA